ncbi:MAG: UDP-3-O-(3-hydroxymyristoyl)glucosamine N-acyltransferase [Planctomycetes bacterium]|nr:UDP-3-O-(3-hydroxymyristoyl)glucosamine N-acyltransferase [Planctomycetota bacterium]
MTDAPAQSLTTARIAALTGGELLGPGDIAIGAMEATQHARTGQLTFIGSARYAAQWATCAASAALIASGIDLVPGEGRALIRVKNVDLAAATVLEALAPAPVRPACGVHPSAQIDPTATLGDDVRIGPHCIVGPRVSLAAGVELHGNVSVLDDSRIGEGTVIWPGVVIRERSILGARCILHANVVIGADGFGYRPSADGKSLVKIPQIGYVQIGDDVEIGAGSCIDRGKFSATVIGSGTKIDNLVQIAHNVRIGRCVVIAGLSGISGSVTIGDGAMLGGGVGIADHVTIGRGVKIGAKAGVMGDIPDGETWYGMPAQPDKIAVRQFLTLKQLAQSKRKDRRDRKRDDKTT